MRYDKKKSTLGQSTVPATRLELQFVIFRFTTILLLSEVAEAAALCQ
jgi:hypothetical protein